LKFDGRSSPLGGNKPRSATNPINAILNYLYALLEAEARIACHAVGLDPALGILHSDTPGRDSLADDVMEVTRPHVDGYVLEHLANHRFAKSDFVETREGQCRLGRELAHELAITTSRWARAVAPVAERVARALADEPDLRVGSTPTPLTQSNRRRASGGDTRRSRKASLLTPKCPRCGDRPTATGTFCEPCAREAKLERIPQLLELATQHLAEARADGKDPAHGGDAAVHRGSANRQRQIDIREWEEANEKPPPEVFTTAILPGLAIVTAGEMARATGLSRPYCSMIKRGAYVPHPMHWAGLQSIGDPAGI
jgi:hypothetical protein